MNKSAEKFERFQREEKIHDVEFKTEAVSYIKDVWRRFKRDKVTVTATFIILIIVFMAIIGPGMSKYDYLEQNLALKNMPPRIPVLEDIGILDGTRVLTVQVSNLDNYADCIVKELDRFTTSSAFGKSEMAKIKVDIYKQRGAEDVYYWFGTDNIGRDLFSRLWQGTRVSLIMAFSVVVINLSIGLVVGSICGYYGGWVDLIIQRIMDVIWNIPSLPLTILLIMLFGSGITSLVLVFCLTGWMGTANSVRMQFYRYKNREYVLAARTMGASDIKIMFRHILPNAIGTIITSCALAVPNVVFQEAGLSYLGLGVQAPNPSIGMLLSDGQKVLMDYPYMILFPSIIIIALMLAFNLFGNGLRDAFNPNLRQ
ncbi:MAG: ABC transporter permease [Ruminococcaceae bacterium]|nr:ABC transporter permease [Oscillospiraceae bacterium]